MSVTGASPETVDTPLKTAGSTRYEQRHIVNLHTGDGNEVFVVDNDMDWAGGATTRRGGDAGAQIIMSDHGNSATLLAHEVGHILGLDHPPGGGDAGTIMEPGNGHSSPSPTRNTMVNYRRITWPLPIMPTCLYPDA